MIVKDNTLNLNYDLTEIDWKYKNALTYSSTIVT